MRPFDQTENALFIRPTLRFCMVTDGVSDIYAAEYFAVQQ
jgi:hypothetical protein